MSAWVWVGVALLGGLGASARFVLDGALSTRSSGSFPVGTFAINITGAMLLGLLAGLEATGATLVLVGTATLGSYTTFSTWMLESHRLTEDADVAGATLNVLASLAVGIGAAAIGRAIGAHA
ncbi:MAG TPA: fluoride efflux transporter CrcB [Solirubrobacteraceae bacterium]|nr:fluoride efflux transporter CrcB [Solirubrobacteraceae bacterium]